MASHGGLWCGPADDPKEYSLDAEVNTGGEGTVWIASYHVRGGPVPVAVKLYKEKIFDKVVDPDELRQRLKGVIAQMQGVKNYGGLCGLRTAFVGASPHGGVPGDDRRVYLVMNLASGPSYGDWVKEHATGRERLAPLQSPATALDEMARAGIVHRDIKPPNIIVEEGTSPSGVPTTNGVLVDFGLTRVGDGLSAFTIGHTPGYDAPEVDTDPSPASDLYAFVATAAYGFLGRPCSTRTQWLEALEAAQLDRDVLALFDEGLSEARATRQRLLEEGGGFSGWLEALRAAATVTRPVPVVRPTPTPTPAPVAGTVPVPIPARPGPSRRGPLAWLIFLIVAIAAVLLAATHPWKATPARTTGSLTGDQGESAPTGAPAATTAAPTTATTTTIPASTVPPNTVAPSAGWGVSAANVTAGTSVGFTYHVGSVGPGQQVVLQRAEGTSSAWNTIATLSPGGGSATIPAVPVGANSYRVAVVDSSGNTLADGGAKTVTGYGTMSLAEILGSNALSPPQTKVIGSQAFPYVWSPNLQSFQYVDDAHDNTMWTVTSSTCRFLSLQVGESTKDQPLGVDQYNLPDVLKIEPQTTDPVITHLPGDQVVTINAMLTPGQAFALTLSGSYYIYVNGSGSCSAPLTFSGGE